MEKKELPPAELWDVEPFSRAALCYRGHSSSTLYAYYSWHDALQQDNDLHPSVAMMLKYRPLDFAKLALEWPHVSHTDPTRLAYTRSVQDGENRRELITSVGKYLARHWPHVSDHERRDVQALFTPDEMYFVHTTAEMILGVENGPRSCMASVGEYLANFSKADSEHMRAWMADPSKPVPDWIRHPYSAYAPEFGWHMALRKRADGQIDGRAVCLTHSKGKSFVRTYRRHGTDPNGWSETDFALQTWLTHRGYSLEGGWPSGAKLRLLPASDPRALAAPYLDGCYRGVRGTCEHNIFEIVHRGHEFMCEMSSGVVFPTGEDEDDDDDSYRDCDNCEGRFHEDNMVSAGRNDYLNICEGCRDRDFILVEGRTRHNHVDEYYIHEDYACSVEHSDRYVDPDYLPNDIVTLADGGYAEQDDCILVGGSWYFDDDDRLVNTIADGEYVLRENAFQDDDGNWWTSREHYLEHNPETETT